jgi:hypothetical protein
MLGYGGEVFESMEGSVGLRGRAVMRERGDRVVLVLNLVWDEDGYGGRVQYHCRGVGGGPYG